MSSSLFKTSLAAVALGAASLAMAGPPVQMASGGGTSEMEIFEDDDVGKVTIAFNAQKDAAGMVKGQAQFNPHDLMIPQFHADVTCLYVVDNVAFVGGTIQVGERKVPIAWAVEDNGQGANADPDRASLVLPTFGIATCDGKKLPSIILRGLLSASLQTWDNGNYQVKGGDLE